MSQAAIEEFISDWSLRDLAARTGRTVGEIVEYAMRSARGRSTAAAAPAAAASTTTTAASTKKTPTKRGRGVDTRTATGRASYQDAVEGVVAGKGGRPTSAAEIRAKVGGTPTQARAALARLIEEGKITYEGKARATRYLAA